MICKNCKKEFIPRKDRMKTARFCSRNCHLKEFQFKIGHLGYGKGISRSEEVKKKISEANKGRKYSYSPQSFKKGHIPWILGVGHSEETKEKMREMALKDGRKPPLKIFPPPTEKICAVCGKGFLVVLSQQSRTYCSKKCHAIRQVSLIPWNKGITWEEFRGENHPRWIGDRNNLKRYSDDNKQRASPAYAWWSKQVKRRDNFKCKIANQDCGGRIEAHHILGWTEFVELRYEINNGITLCHAHHPRKRAEEKRLIPIFEGLVSVSKE